jgi:hypothetical protein
MKELQITDPTMFQHMMSGGFVVKRSEEKTFNCGATDQALEQTINREAKTQGGVIGYTRRKGALLRWLLTRHVTGEYSEAFKSICANPGTSRFHDELRNARMEKDRKDVSSINMIKEFIHIQCQNAFYSLQHSFNIGDHQDCSGSNTRGCEIDEGGSRKDRKPQVSSSQRGSTKGLLIAFGTPCLDVPS